MIYTHYTYVHTYIPYHTMQGPVSLAAASGSAQVVSELLRADIPYRTRDREGRTALHLAARCGHVPVLRVLVAEMRKDKEKKRGGGVGIGRRGAGAGAGDGGDAAEDAPLPGDGNTWMIDGGPFKWVYLFFSFFICYFCHRKKQKIIKNKKTLYCCMYI